MRNQDISCKWIGMASCFILIHQNSPFPWPPLVPFILQIKIALLGSFLLMPVVLVLLYHFKEDFHENQQYLLEKGVFPHKRCICHLLCSERAIEKELSFYKLLSEWTELSVNTKAKSVYNTFLWYWGVGQCSSLTWTVLCASFSSIVLSAGAQLMHWS